MISNKTKSRFAIIKKPLNTVWKVSKDSKNYSRNFNRYDIEISSEANYLTKDAVVQILILGKYLLCFKVSNLKETIYEKAIIFSILNKSKVQNNHKNNEDRKSCNFKIKLVFRQVTTENSTLITWKYSTDKPINENIVFNNIKLILSLVENFINKDDLINTESITVNKNITDTWNILLNYKIFTEIKPMHYLSVRYDGDSLEKGKDIEIEFCNREKYVRQLKGSVTEFEDNAGFKKFNICYELNETNPFILRTSWLLNAINDKCTFISFVNCIKRNQNLKTKKRIIATLKKYLEERLDK